MDYQAIEQSMAKKGFLADPAFQDITFLIEDIPCEDSCPLGLYFPDSGHIVIPSEGEEATLLHELGHRHGHYYHNNLSERYAENFREKYQKGKALLYIGNDFSKLPKFGTLFQEGDKGAIEIAFAQPLVVAHGGLCDVMNQINAVGYDIFCCECISCGYPLDTLKHCQDAKCPRCGGQMQRANRPGSGKPRMYSGNSEIPWVRIEFTKSADWMVIIGSALTATVLATVGAIGYAIYKVSKELPWIIPVSLVGTGLFFLLRAMRREAMAEARARGIIIT